MAHDVEFELTADQVRAVILALERAGLPKGSSKQLLASFTSQEIVIAAQACYRKMRAYENELQKRGRGIDGPAEVSDTEERTRQLERQLRTERDSKIHALTETRELQRRIDEAVSALEGGNREKAKVLLQGWE